MASSTPALHVPPLWSTLPRECPAPAKSPRYNFAMKIFRGDETASQLADSKTFVGEARVKRLASADDGVPVVVYQVTSKMAGGPTGTRIPERSG